MPWLPLTLNDIQDREAAALVEVLQTAALGEGQDDPIPELLSSVTAHLRGLLAARNAWVDPDPDTLPPSLKDLAVRQVLRLAKNRLNLPLTPDERRDAATDDQTLRDLARGQTHPEPPADPSAQPITALISAPQRQATRQHLDGLR